MALPYSMFSFIKNKSECLKLQITQYVQTLNPTRHDLGDVRAAQT